MAKYKIFSLLLVFVAAFIFFGFKLLVVKHVSEVRLENSYILESEFSKVKSVMVRNDVLEEIVEHEQGEIVDRKWNKFIISGNRPFREGVDVDGSGNFVVSKNDPETGKVLLKFKQQISLTKSQILSKTNLVEPSEYIKNIETTTEMKPSDNQTLVNVKIYIKYERFLPKNMIKSVDKKVQDAANKTLENNKEVITNLVNKYADKRFVLPVPLKKSKSF